jgi:NADH-quinone oxidoreductase subunit M
VPAISVLAIVGIIYGALVAFAQKDVKKLVAYSSVSHLGFVMLGLFALNTQGIEGGILQMINHGISTGALFLIVGMLYDRRHSRMMEDFGGLWKKMPVFAGLFLVVVLSSIALPGLNGFAGEFLILVGVFLKNVAFAAFAALGMILSAVYLLWMFQQVMFGEIKARNEGVFNDAGLREKWILVPIVLLIFWIGIWPGFFLSRMHASVEGLLERVNSANTVRVEQVRDGAVQGVSIPTGSAFLQKGRDSGSF